MKNIKNIDLESIAEKTGLEKTLFIAINNVFSKDGNIEKVLIFGSRVNNSYKFNSDLDIAVFPEDKNYDLSVIISGIEEIYTPYKIDVLNFYSINKEKMITNILNEGILFYAKS